MDYTDRGETTPPDNMLGAMMNKISKTSKKAPALLDVVALLADIPGKALASGQVGTVVELLDAANLLVEFSDDEGQPYVIAPVQASQLLVLHYAPEAV